MRTMMIGRFIWIVAATEVILLLHIWLSKEIVVLSALSPDKKLIAQISATRDFPYLNVDGYLVVRQALTGRITKTEFLVARDTFDDITTEVRSVSWKGSSIVVDIDRTHYSGSGEFSTD